MYGMTLLVNVNVDTIYYVSILIISILTYVDVNVPLKDVLKTKYGIAELALVLAENINNALKVKYLMKINVSVLILVTN